MCFDIQFGLLTDTVNLYGFGDYLKTQHEEQKDVDVIIEILAKGWAEHFDPNSLIILRLANYNSSAFKKASDIKVPILKILAKKQKSN